MPNYRLRIGGQTIDLSAPSQGREKSLSSLFTIGYSGSLSGSVTITPSDGEGGQFWPLNYAPGAAITLSAARPEAKFYYAPPSSGVKSITFTNDGGLINPGAVSYTATAASPGSATPFRLTRGGSTIGTYATLQECKDHPWASGDTVKCTGGTYVVYNSTDPGCTLLVDNPGGIQTGVNVDTLTIEWETADVPMILDYSRYCAISLWSGGQPQLLTMGSASRTLTVRGLYFRGARPPIGSSWIGAGIWTTVSTGGGTYPTATLTTEYCKFWNHADGIHTQETHYGLSTYIRYCVFEDNSDNQGLRHDIYTGKGALTYVEGCTFRRTAEGGYPQEGLGHFIKSRCRATTVKANLLDGYMSSAGLGGVAQSINTPNGGVVQVVGNVINHYGYQTEGGRGEPLRYGDDQHTAGVDTSSDPSLTTHSLLFAQNTVRQYAGHTVGTLTTARPLALFPGGDSFTSNSLLDGSGTLITPTATIQNNLFASDFTARLSTFIGLYANNSSVSKTLLDDYGTYMSQSIAGSPATNNADKEWAGDFLITVARTDTNRGGRSVSLPTWVPTTAWVWTDIPGTVWSESIKADGTGAAPAVTAADPGTDKSYIGTWAYSGPCYSRARHEFWMFGGGHASNTINILTRWNLNLDTPTVTMVCAPSTETVRNADIAGSYPDTEPYFSDGKPYSPHSYLNNMYRDDADEFVSFGIANIATGPGGGDMGGGAEGYLDIAACSRAGTWAAANTYTDIPSGFGPDATFGPRILSRDGSICYYWPDEGQALQKFTFATNTHAAVGGPTTPQPPSRCSLDSAGTSTLHAITDSSSGWAVETRNLLTGARQVVTVSGYSLPTGLQCFGVEWAESIGKYIVVYIGGGWTGGADDAAITSFIVCTLEMTSASTAAAALVSVATGDGAPAVRSAICGMGFDTAYDCLLIVTSYSELVKALKVS